MANQKTKLLKKINNTKAYIFAEDQGYDSPILDKYRRSYLKKKPNDGRITDPRKKDYNPNDPSFLHGKKYQEYLKFIEDYISDYEKYYQDLLGNQLYDFLLNLFYEDLDKSIYQPKFTRKTGLMNNFDLNIKRPNFSSSKTKIKNILIDLIFDFHHKTNILNYEEGIEKTNTFQFLEINKEKIDKSDIKEFGVNENRALA